MGSSGRALHGASEGLVLLGVGHTGRSVVRRPRASYGWWSAVRTSFVRTAARKTLKNIKYITWTGGCGKCICKYTGNTEEKMLLLRLVPYLGGWSLDTGPNFSDIDTFAVPLLTYILM